jgi:hypothetical protein
MDLYGGTRVLIQSHDDLVRDIVTSSGIISITEQRQYRHIEGFLVPVVARNSEAILYDLRAHNWRTADKLRSVFNPATSDTF